VSVDDGLQFVIIVTSRMPRLMNRTLVLKIPKRLETLKLPGITSAIVAFEAFLATSIECKTCNPLRMCLLLKFGPKLH